MYRGLIIELQLGLHRGRVSGFWGAMASALGPQVAGRPTGAARTLEVTRWQAASPGRASQAPNPPC